MPELWARCLAVGASTWSDTLDRMAAGNSVLDGLSQRSGSGRIAGPALTVKLAVGELNEYPLAEFAVGKFLDVIEPGAVVVIDMGGACVSTFGGLAAQKAIARGARGVVVDGACRDVAELIASGLWVASRHVTPRSGKMRVRVEGVNVPVTAGGVQIDPGDCIIADETGIVRVRAVQLPEVLERAEELESRDRAFAQSLSAGETFSSLAARLHHS
jgi:regulator of RNase E activity RraA